MARRALLVVLLAAAACGHRDPPWRLTSAQPGDVAIVGATVIPMDRDGVLRDHAVLVRGDRIVAVVATSALDARAATVIDGRGRWETPGLADMHVPFWDRHDLDLFLLNGVTTVRNLFGSPTHLRWRAAVARGELAGPTIVTAGPIIDGDPPTWPGSAVVTTAAEATAAVQAQHAAGYDWIKVYGGLWKITPIFGTIMLIASLSSISTNLNGATTATAITLTLPQGSITLPIAQSGRLVGGQIQSQMMWSKAIQHEGDAWVGSAAITHRHTVPVQARTTQADFAATWLQNTASPTHYLALAAAQLVDQGGSPRSRGFKLALGHEWRHPLAQDCRITALAEYNLTGQPASATENGRYKGISLGQVCQHNFGVLWRGGQDTPQHEARPGGVQYKSEWVIQGRANWAHARQTLTYTHTMQRDASGYSPLLSLGAARRLTRHALQMEWTQPLTPGKGLVGYKTAWSPSHWFVAFDGSVQRSNLALFCTRSATVSIGLKWDGR